LRIVFAGTPVFAARALAALHAAGHDIALVLTRPDQPARRGQKLVASPVKEWALAHGLSVAQPASLRDPAAQADLAGIDADLMVVAAYGLILPQAVLDLPRLGCLNIHASLLPRWRGAAPIQRAIEAGDLETGITIMQMDAGLDTGAMRLVQRLPIGPESAGGDIHDALAELGGQAIVQALALLQAGALPSEPQPAEGVTYAHKLTREDARLDFALPAQALVDRIRAFDPVPGCTAILPGGQPVKIWRARVHPHPHQHPWPGTVIRASGQGITVACGPGGTQAIDLIELQRPGGRRLAVREWLAGASVNPGDRLESGAVTPT
jgi:methionyl-tRNA formyltransferase